VQRTLDSVFAQDYPGAVEMVHIDSGSKDGTVEAAASHGVDTRTIDQADFHHGRTRNQGADLASNPILVYLTQDAVPAGNQWLRNLVAPFQDPRVGGVYGKQTPPEGMGELRRYAMLCLYPDTREVRDLAEVDRPTVAMTRFSNANCAVRRDLCRAIRFPEDVLVCEDHGMCWGLLQAGQRVVYEPAAEVIHGHERRILDEFGWAVDNAISLKRMGILGNPALSGELRYGIQRIVREFKHFSRQGRYGLATGSFAVSLVRWVGVQVGKHEERLLHALLRRLSPGTR